jgi:hypothetical protein
VRVIHTLYVLLFKQPPSANSALPAYHAEMEEGMGLETKGDESTCCCFIKFFCAIFTFVLRLSFFKKI